MQMTQTSKVDIHAYFPTKNKPETTRFRYKQLHVGKSILNVLFMIIINGVIFPQ